MRGAEERCGQCARPSYAKVKLSSCEPEPAKFYPARAADPL